MNFFADLMAGGAEGLAKGAGQFVKDVRAVITGKEILTSEQQASILARADALLAAAQKFEHDTALGQIAINKVDAESGSLFKGGWRPAVGWSCAGGVFYQFLLRAILPWFIQVMCLLTGSTVEIPEMPELEIQTLMTLLGALLGFGGFRVVEKIKGVASK